jgi:phospholipase C
VVGAGGFETEPEHTIEPDSAQSRSSDPPEPIEVERPSVRNDRLVDDSKTNGEPVQDLANVVETALAEALTLAAAAGEWTVVAAIAAELEARRVARAGVPAGVVVPLARKA